MPILATPLALLGLAALPVVTAIYLLRNRSRRVPVSSLMLWTDQRRAREGGLQIQRIQTPLLLLLELLALAMLAIAATDPHIRRQASGRPLVIVLDDSYSMLAEQKSGVTARSRALEEIEKLLDRESDRSVQFLLAGKDLQLLGPGFQQAAHARRQLERWTCHSATARVTEAVAMAMAMQDGTARVLVITDRPRDEAAAEQPQQPGAPPPAGSRLKWWAFGRAMPNVAFIGASRTSLETVEATQTKRRCLLEVANLWPEKQRTTLVIEGLDDSGKALTQPLTLGPREVQRLILPVVGKPKPIRARLDDDPLAIDNNVLLLPSVHRRVRVAIDIADPPLHAAVTKGLGAALMAVLTETDPELVFSDAATPAGPGTAWRVRFADAPGAVAFAGPFVLDRTHPLTEGLDLSSVIWGAARDAPLPGRQVITVGNTPLLTDSERPSGARDIRLRLVPQLSTVTTSPNWPILIWNVLRLRAGTEASLQRVNVRLGTDAVLRVKAADIKPRSGDGGGMTVIAPDKTTRRLYPRDRTVPITPNQTGRYTVKTASTEYTFACNALAQSESDLSARDQGKSGDWVDDEVLRTEYRSIAWIFMLLAMTAMFAHLILMAARSGGPAT